MIKVVGRGTTRTWHRLEPRSIGVLAVYVCVYATIPLLREVLLQECIEPEGEFRMRLIFIQCNGCVFAVCISHTIHVKVLSFLHLTVDTQLTRPVQGEGLCAKLRS